MNLRERSILRGLLRIERGCAGFPTIHRRILAFLRSEDSGSALVELAIALPVYLIIITGMVSTVMALYSYQQLAFACYTASEAVGANRGKPDPCALVAASVTNALPTWTPGNFTYTLWFTDNVGGTISGPTQYGPYTGTAAATCTGSETTPGNGFYAWYNAQNEPVTVRVQYVYKWFPIYSDRITTGNLTVAESSLVR